MIWKVAMTYTVGTLWYLQLLRILFRLISVVLRSPCWILSFNVNLFCPVKLNDKVLNIRFPTITTPYCLVWYCKPWNAQKKKKKARQRSDLKNPVQNCLKSITCSNSERKIPPSTEPGVLSPHPICVKIRNIPQ